MRVSAYGTIFMYYSPDCFVRVLCSFANISERQEDRISVLSEYSVKQIALSNSIMHNILDAELRILVRGTRGPSASDADAESNSHARIRTENTA